MSILNLQSGGDFTPHIRFMASTCSWKKSAEGGAVDFDFTQAIFDLEQIETGWCAIAEGEAPQWIMDEDLTTPAPKPNTALEWKRGFKVNVFSPKMFGDAEAVREFGTNATGACMGIQELYAAFETEAPKNQGKVPVVKFNGGTPTKVGKGNTNVPKLEIVKWVDRPDALPLKAEPPLSTPAPAQEAPAATNNEEDEF